MDTKPAAVRAAWIGGLLTSAEILLQTAGRPVLEKILAGFAVSCSAAVSKPTEHGSEHDRETLHQLLDFVYDEIMKARVTIQQRTKK
jgi:hypothetical protein